MPGEAGLSDPDDVAFDAAGYLYLSEPHGGRVTRRAVTGGPLEVLCADLPGANGITVGTGDRLFVSECRPGGRLVEVDRDRPDHYRVIVGDLAMPNALEMGADGELYLPEVSSGRVLAIAPDTGTVRVVLEGIAYPSAVKFDPSGRLVVCEAGTGALHWLELSSGERGVLARTRRGVDNVCFGPRGMLLASNFLDGGVDVLAAGTGDGRAVVAEAALLYPFGLGPAPDGGLLVADGMRLLGRAPAGTWTVHSSVPGAQEGSLVAAGTCGNRVLALGADGRLFGFDPAGQQSILAAASSVAPRGSALATTGVRAALGRSDGSVVELDGDGTFGRQWPTGLDTVSALALGPDATVACDSAAGRVTVALADERQHWDGFAGPCAVALVGDRIYVAEQLAGRLTEIGPGGARTVLCTGMPFRPPVDSSGGRPRATASLLARDGTLLIGCDGDASVRTLTPGRR